MKKIFLLLVVLLLNTALFSEVKNEKYEYSLSTNPLRNLITYYNLSLNRYNYEKNDEYRFAVSFMNKFHYETSIIFSSSEADISIYTINFSYRKYLSKQIEKGFYLSSGIGGAIIKHENQKSTTNFFWVQEDTTYQDTETTLFGISSQIGYEKSWEKMVAGVSLSGFIPVIGYNYDEKKYVWADKFAIVPMLNFNLGYIF
ncbi:MAG: hypothetical protein U9N76_07950 [Candidatus Marinimicrobia bacterium]|nr:hypothetical protein [Candidatus Neomarinimicrobiota bacterium]